MLTSDGHFADIGRVGSVTLRRSSRNTATSRTGGTWSARGPWIVTGPVGSQFNVAQPWVKGYPLGTDQLGRDYLSRLISGVRISLFVGLAATTLHVVVAVLIGGSAGFIGGKLDLLVQRFVMAILIGGSVIMESIFGLPSWQST